MKDQITIPVDAAVGEAYRTALPEQQRKLDLIIILTLRHAFQSRTALAQIMSDISRKAQERGLTPEILKSILDEQ
ncbi:MAG: hypothetical protein WD648_05370 [Planctomycetaceae bacterium]